MAGYSEVTHDHPVPEHGFIFGAILDEYLCCLLENLECN